MRTSEYYGGIDQLELNPVDYKRLQAVASRTIGSVLDIGCNNGELLGLIGGGRLKVGIEVNRSRAKQANALIADAESTLPLKDKSFDTVCCLEILEHLKNPEDLMEEVARVCRKRIIITVPYQENIKRVNCIHCGLPTSVHLHSYNEDEIKSLIPKTFAFNTISTIKTRDHKIKKPSRLPIWISFGEIKILWYLLVADSR